MPDNPRHSARIVVVGAGFGGLTAAIELRRRGFRDIVIFEKAGEVGGVWRENTYPGAACDVPSPYYSLSYAPNPRWQHRFARQADILGYMRDIAERFELRPLIRFGTEVTAADFDEQSATWRVHTNTGDSVSADILVCAVGQLSRPAWPAIEGRTAFAGDSFHSAEWDHSVDLSGKRVAVIGTGASAIQFVPEIQPHVDRLLVFQRSAPYVFPRMDKAFSQRHHRLFERVPFLQRLERRFWFAVTETLAVAFLYSPALSKVLTACARTHLRLIVKDRALRAKLWPDYRVGCKRVLFSSDYLPALTKPNVDLVTDEIGSISPRGIVMADGTLHEVDAIVYGTGFTATDFLAPMKIRGVGGTDLRESWSDGARAHLGITVPGFPNLFLMYGPNTNLGSGSIVEMQECQARYIAAAAEYSAEIAAPMAMRAEIAAEFDRTTQARLVDGVWSTCSSWYRNASGRVVNNWPGTVTEYRRRTGNFQPEDFEAFPKP
jgi:cation diffusion facilitator CzcD-associated flavoprotein CzcO